MVVKIKIKVSSFFQKTNLFEIHGSGPLTELNFLQKFIFVQTILKTRVFMLVGSYRMSFFRKTDLSKDGCCQVLFLRSFLIKINRKNGHLQPNVQKNDKNNRYRIILLSRQKIILGRNLTLRHSNESKILISFIC